MMKSVTKEKVFHVLKLVLLAVTITLVLLSLLGTVAHASGLVDDTANILWTTTSLIFMWTADGTGSRGTGWTVSENR